MRDLIKRILREELTENRSKVSDEEIRRRISKFETLGDLRKYDSATYVMAKRRGEDFFNDVTKDLVRKRPPGVKSTRWSNMSEEELLRIINKFTDTNALRMYEPRLYTFLRHKGKDYYNKMTQGLTRVKPRLTPDDILNIASQYDTFAEFTVGDPSAYNALRHRYYNMGDKELWDKVVNRIPKKEQRDPYTDDELIQIASKYPSLKSFSESEPKAAHVLGRKRNEGNLKLFNDATKHMQRGGKPRILKDNEIDSIKSVISQYDNLKDFVENEPNLFISMKRRGPASFYDLTKDLEQNYDVKW
jgi:tRNA uridine 5-carbamoylmethylation protein Kti12